MVCRFNALLTIPATFAVLIFMYLIRKQLKRALLVFAAFIIVVISYKGATEVAEYLTHGDYMVFEGTSTIDIMPSVMVSNIAMEKYSELNDEEIEFVETYVMFGYIKESQKKYEDAWLFNYNFMSTMDTKLIEKDKEAYYDMAVPLIMKYPFVALKAYEKITAIVWAVPNYGYTSSRNAYVASALN